MRSGIPDIWLIVSASKNSEIDRRGALSVVPYEWTPRVTPASPRVGIPVGTEALGEASDC